MSTSFDGLISKVKECGQKTVSVAVAQDSAVLEAVRAAKDRGIANAVLVGDEEKIKAVAAKDGITAIKIKSGRMLLAYGFLRKVFEIFESYQTSIDMITTSEVGVSVTIDNTIHLTEILDDLK